MGVSDAAKGLASASAGAAAAESGEPPIADCRPRLIAGRGPDRVVPQKLDWGDCEDAPASQPATSVAAAVRPHHLDGPAI